MTRPAGRADRGRTHGECTGTAVKTPCHRATGSPCRKAEGIVCGFRRWKSFDPRDGSPAHAEGVATSRAYSRSDCSDNKTQRLKTPSAVPSGKPRTAKNERMMVS